MADDNLPLVPPDSRADQGLDLASKLVTVLDVAVPGLGGVFGSFLSGWATQRRIERITEVVDAIGAEFRGFKSGYVKTDEFGELFEKVLRQAAEERNEAKRRVYRDFILNAIRRPGQPYDEQVLILRTIDDLHPDHIRVLRAMAQEPGVAASMGIGSPRQTLARRLPDIPMDRVEDLVRELNARGITKLDRLRTTMTARGAEDLRSDIMSLGRKVLDSIAEREP
jgi:hypothetical protein